MRRIGAQPVNGQTVYAADLGGMTDQPALEVLCRSFGMKLKGEQGFSVAEGLVSTNRCGGEECRAMGKIKRITMRMEDRHASEAPHEAMFTFGAERNRRPTDFFCRPRINMRTQGAGKKLRAETNPTRRPATIY